MTEQMATRMRALARAKGLKPTAKAIDRLSGSTEDREAVRWAFLQWELRERARAKFKHADEMLFTREALEQATREEVSQYHASRFPEGVLVADLTAGIGGDLSALAARGPAVGYETDQERAEYAVHNALVNGHKVEVHVADALAAEWPDCVFADPSRRVAGRRTLVVDEFQPDPRVLAERMRGLGVGGIKLSPLLSDEALKSLGPELAFVATKDECPEVVVWAGREAFPMRYAVWADTGEKLLASGHPPRAESPLEYVYEAHAAAIRAHALGTLADSYGLHALGDSNGYLTGSGLVESRWLKAYRTLHAGKGDSRQTRAVLRRMGAGTPVVKSRAGIAVEALRRELKIPNGVEEGAIVAAYSVGKSIRHVVLESLSTESKE
jgi:hypothetical protein